MLNRILNTQIVLTFPFGSRFEVTKVDVMSEITDKSFYPRQPFVCRESCLDIRTPVPTCSSATAATAVVPARLLRLRPPGGMMLTWLALFVLKLATILLESTAFRLILLLLLLLLLMLLLMLMTRVRMPRAKDAKSTAFEPLMIDVLAALGHGTVGGLWYINGKSLLRIERLLLLTLCGLKAALTGL